MTRGKYAERARTKKDADARYAAEVAESNRLRAHLHELRGLREENASLRKTIEALKADVAQGTSERVRALEGTLKEAVEICETLEKNRDDLIEEFNNRIKDCLNQLAGHKWNHQQHELAAIIMTSLDTWFKRDKGATESLRGPVRTAFLAKRFQQVMRADGYQL